MRPHVVILGCGFGGLFAARALRGVPLEVTVVDRVNHHLFQLLLYQVATAGLSAPAIAAPIRHILAGQENVTVLLGDVQRIDASHRASAICGYAAETALTEPPRTITSQDIRRAKLALLYYPPHGRLHTL